MAKRKSKTRDKSRRGAKNKPWWLGLLRFIFTPPGLYLTLIIIAVVIIIVFRGVLAEWGRAINNLFGWGLVLIVLALGTLVVVVGQQKVSSFIYNWNRWLGSIAFMFAFWGILASLGLGGTFGRGIISYSVPLGILRILGLIVIGIVLVAPKASFHLAAKFISWLGKRFKKEPVPKYLREQLPP